MGKTVESYRMALESEIAVWNGFARALRIEERQAFEVLMDACRGYASAASNATRPVLFEPMMMSILLNQQMSLMRLQKELNGLKQQPNSQP
jgi:hypothetical protein